ncbi:hypothetical protein [Streptomyces huiliensis]|uniref:hypothetical protein n=1 Tax=Streptomyces huiliensis TaxID=2876027 RepID=UPI001CBF73DC|nr:hypothetical protein [Streptomyces huiliensis]MBZ4324197.1 hypothetical protein [Streptomyces huiliensis]
MTSRTPRDSRLRLVPRQPIAAARKAVADRGSRPAPRPPAGIPGRPELARQARAGLTGAVRLARWAAAEYARGAGPGPDEAGALGPETAERAAADLGLTPRQVQADWDRARLAGLLELHGGSARPGWRLTAWDRDDSAVLRGWVALFDAWSLAHPEPAGTDPTVAAEVVEAAPQLLSVMHLSAGSVSVAMLLDLLRQRVAEIRAERCEIRYDGPEPVPAGAPVPAPRDGSAEDVGPLSDLLAWALDGLASVGALVVRGGGGDGAGPEAEAVLTPLGNWAVWVKLEQICVAAQSPAGNIELSAEAMLRGCADLSPGPARAEYRAWLAARPVRSAVTELLEAARGDDALVRGLAFEALRAVGAPAEPAVRAVVDETVLRPYALLWLAEQEGHDPDEAAEVLTREEATWLWVDTAAAVADHGESRLLVRHLESAVQGTVPGLLAEVRAVGHPRTVQVLVALAAAHPDPALAKAVRRAAFQVHRGGS